jgi:ketosteroid isomerase-like protein
MSSTESNKDLLRRAYRRWNDTKGGSVGDWMALADENISFGSLAEGAEVMPFTAPIKRKEALKTYFDGLLADWSMIHYTIDHYVAEGDSVVAIGSTSWKNKRTGKTVETRKVDVWKFEKGKAVEFYEYFDTAKVAAACSGSLSSPASA